MLSSSLDAYVTITSYGQTVSYPYNTDRKSEVSSSTSNEIDVYRLIVKDQI